MTFKEVLEIKEDIWTYLKRSEKPIIMYGTGNGADKIIDVMEAKGIQLSGIFASDSFVRDRIFRGFKVKKYSDFCDEIKDFTVIVSFATQRHEVLANIYKIASERELYAPDVPVYGTGLFDMDYFFQNKDRLEAVYNMLSDDISKNVFCSTLAFKLTGKIDYLRNCQSSESESCELVMKNLRATNYVDIGAYTGDTIEKYIQYFGNSIKIFAFEPDIKNYNKLIDRLSSKGIKCKSFNAAAWNKTETLRFYSHSGRAGTAVKGSEAKFRDIQAFRIDDVIDQDESIGHIKVDAEGSELQVIAGLEGVIRRNSPCIKIAAYHKNEDYYAIPEAISKINSNFSLYMRHLEYIPAWDTDFFFVFT